MNPTVGMLIMLGVCLLAGVWFLSTVMGDSEAAKKDTETKIREAQRLYRAALDALKTDPTNIDLRQRALELGRAYAGLTRNGGTEAVYEEVAIANDIQAVTGGK